MGHSCGTLLRKTLLGHSCETLRDTLVVHSCAKLLNSMTLLWSTHVQHSGMALSWTFVFECLHSGSWAHLVFHRVRLERLDTKQLPGVYLLATVFTKCWTCSALFPEAMLRAMVPSLAEHVKARPGR